MILRSRSSNTCSGACPIVTASTISLPPCSGRQALPMRATSVRRQSLLATYNFTRHLQGYAGYSFFLQWRIYRKNRPRQE